MRNLNILGVVERQRVRRTKREPGELTQRRVVKGVCMPNATEINRKDVAIGLCQLRHLKMVLVKVISVELWGQNTVVDLRKELELLFLNV